MQSILHSYTTICPYLSPTNNIQLLDRFKPVSSTNIGSLWVPLGPRSFLSPIRRPSLILKKPPPTMARGSARASPSVASTTSNSASLKRKRPGVDGVKYYAVREGRKPGVYATWDECLSQIKGHKGALCESSALLFCSSISLT